MIEVEVVDRVGGHEVTDLEGLRRLHTRLVEILVGHHHVAALRELVALDDLAPGNLDAFLLTEPLVVDRALVLGVQEAKGQLVLALGGGVERDGHGHQSERERAFPHRTRPRVTAVAIVLLPPMASRRMPGHASLSSNANASDAGCYSPA